MKNKLFIISTLLGIEANGQSQKPDIINSAGMTIKNPSYEVAYSLGEIAITTISNSSHTITQGFLQPHYQIITEIGDFKEEYFMYSPVPVINEFTIQTNLSIHTLKIVNAEGKLIEEKKWDNFPISISTLIPGLYIVHALNKENEIIKTFKITRL